MNSKELNRENKNIWNANAKTWNDRMGAFGNDWHLKLIAPETERLLNLESGDTLLDIGCGNGMFARRMANKDISVTAFDFSESNIELAKSYSTHNINYFTLDATLESDLLKLTGNRYDGIVANMVFMDMANIEVLFAKINSLLKTKGVFVFSIQHPAFNSEYATLNKNNSLTLTNYIDKSVSKGVAISDQPEKQYYFHRPISYYVKLGKEHGLVVNGLEEPTFGEIEKGDDVYTKIPPILIISMISK